MSRESYIKGFCKAASDRNVDPQRLAQYALTKSAGGKEIWEKVKAYLDQAKDKARSVKADVLSDLGDLRGKASAKAKIIAEKASTKAKIIAGIARAKAKETVGKYRNLTPKQRAIISASLGGVTGAGAGAGVGALVGGKKGALSGSLVGLLGGAGAGLGLDKLDSVNQHLGKTLADLGKATDMRDTYKSLYLDERGENEKWRKTVEQVNKIIAEEA